MEDIKKREKIPFKPDYRIAILSGIGILGFIAGCLFLFYSDLFSKNRSVFHEISYQPRDYFSKVVYAFSDSLTREINERKETVVKYGETKNPDTIKKKNDLIARNNNDSIIINQLSTYRKYFEGAAESDTIGFKALNNALHFQITPDSINKWDRIFKEEAYNWKKGTVVLDSVGYYIKDPKIPITVKGIAYIEASKASSDIGFISKYPAAGIWLLLILIFCSFCFITISTAVHLQEKVLGIFEEQQIDRLSKGSYYWICFFVMLVIALMGFTWNSSFYDEHIVKDIFFMKNLTVSMNYLIIPLGSIAGAFCLAGFIYTASMLSFFAQPLIKIRKEVKEQRLALNQSNLAKTGQDAALNDVTPEQITLAKKEAEQTKQELVFNRLAKIFQNYFQLAAIILSLMVLCTGALFSIINSLDFVKLLADDWGYSPARGDFIYLYGGLYTIILLLVYVPAKIRFAEVDIWGKPTGPTGNGKWYDFLKNPFGQIKDVLVATSPLLVSLIQSLFDLIFKN